MILAGDIGGTKTVLGLFERASAGVALLREETRASREHDSLEAIVELFLAGSPAGERARISAACFGVAGAVVGGEAKTTNLPWIFSETSLAAVSGVRRVKLLNDLEAAAYGMLFLAEEELAVLNAGTRRRFAGNVAVIAAGTGLGEAMLWWDGERHQPVATEGGHADFAPSTETEDALLDFLRAELDGHVSVERVLSGPGIHNLYRFLRDSGTIVESPAIAARLATGDPNAIISAAALAAEDSLCEATLDLFAAAYGAEAGNMALRTLAVGGVVVGGGIAPRILPILRSGEFMRRFQDKGRFAELLGSLPVLVAKNPKAPLLGAAHYAARLSE